MFKGFSFKYAISIIIGYVTLFFSPAIYLGLTSGNGWWPLFASIVVGFVQVMAASAISGLLSNDMMSLKEQHSPLAGGLLCGLSICGLLFWLVFPSLLGYTSLFENTFIYYGFYRSSESPSIISIAFFLIACLVYIMFISGSVEVAGLKIDKGIKSIRNSSPFLKGVVFSIFFFFLVGVVSYLIPVSARISYNTQIKHLNEKIDSINNSRNRIKEIRSKEERVLSFADFKLGSSLDSCINVINSSYEYSILPADKVQDKYKSYSITIGDVDYSTVFDSLLYVSYEWDNEPTVIGLFCRKNKLLAIQFKTAHEIDSIVSLYSQKYGETETILPREVELSDPCIHYLFDRHDSPIYSEPGEQFADTNIWTFKNAIISIRRQKYGDCYITYFDRSCERLLKALQDKLEQERRILEERRNDSIRRIEEYEQRVRNSEERMRVRKHKESIEKI